METEYQASLGDAFEAHPRVGELLRRHRIERGMELVDVARETRVPLRHLGAIEADAHDSLPALPYSIGFVKSFARAVGLSADDVAAQFRAETTKTPHAPAAVSIEPLDESRVPSRGIVVGSAAALVAAVALAVAWGSGAFTPTPPPPAVPAETVSVEETMSPVAVAEPAATTPAAPGVAPPPQVAGTAATGVPTAGAVTGVPAAGAVTITAIEDAWIKVYDAATRGTVKMGVLTVGERYDVPTDRGELLLWTGRAGALQVAVGGRVLPPLGGRAQTIRDVSLAPAALAARSAPTPAPAPAPTSPSQGG